VIPASNKRQGISGAPPVIALRHRSARAARELRLFQQCCDCRLWNRWRPAPGSIALLPSQASTQLAKKRVVNLLAVSRDGRRRANLRFWAGSDDVFHGAIELGTVSGTTSNGCARQTIADLIYEMRGARHGVNISYFTIASNRVVAGASLGPASFATVQRPFHPAYFAITQHQSNGLLLLRHCCLVLLRP